MWIRNKRTGMIWEIVDEKMIKRLLNSEDYEEVQPQQEQVQQDQQEQDQQEKQQEQQEEEQKIDLKSMKFNDLKRLASEKGINTFGMSKKDIIKALKKMGV